MAWLQHILSPFLSRSRARKIPSSDSFVGEDFLDDGAIVKVYLDSLEGEERIQFQSLLSERMGYTPFVGSVKYAWGKGYVENTHSCPRCGAATEVCTANFIYATQIELRVMFAPAGHFCTRCPSVVIDEAMIQAGISDPRHLYRGMMGVDYHGKREADYFKTWNGEKVVLVFDENKTLLGIDTIKNTEQDRGPGANGGSQKKDKRKKREKAARRANRLKKRR